MFRWTNKINRKNCMTCVLLNCTIITQVSFTPHDKPENFVVQHNIRSEILIPSCTSTNHKTAIKLRHYNNAQYLM